MIMDGVLLNLGREREAGDGDGDGLVVAKAVHEVKSPEVGDGGGDGALARVQGGGALASKG